MASPAPDVPKPQDAASEKESKPEVNGHASSTDERPSESTSKPADEPQSSSNKPLVNGDGSAEDDSATKSPKEDSAPLTNGGAVQSSATEEEASKPETKETDPSSPKAANEDVEMADSEPPKDTGAAATTNTTQPDTPKGDQSADAKADEDVEMAEEPSEPETKAEDAVKPAEEATVLPASEVDVNPASLSQLAIESTETDKPSTETAPEVSMTDAPSAKVAREREDDTTEEPPPKRARTEPREDEPVESKPADATTPKVSVDQETVEAEAPSIEPQKLDDIKDWNDPEINNKPLTPHQRRMIRQTISRIKKTKRGNNFRDSVIKLWPMLSDGYLAKIDKPMDLSELDRTIRDPSGSHVTFGDFKRDLALIYENSLGFNGPVHDVTLAAFTAVHDVWVEAVAYPSEEASKPKGVAKPKLAREPRTALSVEPAKRQSSGPAASPPARTPEVKTEVAAAQEAPAALRRASTAEGDRPKRTVRAPKSKDIDYTPKSSRKKLKPELQFAEEVLTEMMSPKHDPNGWFLNEVDIVALNIPHYHSIVKNEMYFNKVVSMLASGEIASLKDFDKAMKLIFANCYQFNGPPEQMNNVSLLAQQLEKLYKDQMKGKDGWLAKHAKANAPPASVSNASDDDDDEEEEDEGPDVAAAAATSAKEVEVLQARLREESQKLNDMFMESKPNQTMIQLQDSIVKSVQMALLEAKNNQATHVKPEKPTKKASKPAKTKSAGGAAARKASTAAAPAKKSGGTKKAGKKTLTAADKDLIANAINDLEYPHLDRAIDIIKRDTGQAENNDGELELDIDQLSNEAMLKLWELLKKVLPGFGKDTAPVEVSPEAKPAKQPKNAAAAPAAAKNKKNKPMSAQEQEARIAQLQSLRDLYKGDQPQQTNVTQAPTPTAESSDDSDSEEE